ncbi:hypothetical protein KQI74_22665 [Paenibacillus barcinonensis]|uniref:hypothetical protein n=1 Tax=Paenibacillus barcinonensis TaxID=198119 RepID=UPI001C1157B0|nr:hypothetical protein [Paenibacillus barcinonensis]MBU5355091.1 hypothetical protein [Paenibacillus barcinonensis]
MSAEEIVSLIANVGFPVSLCFILLRYILQTLGEKLDRLDKSVNQLNDTIQEFDIIKIAPQSVTHQSVEKHKKYDK